MLRVTYSHNTPEVCWWCDRTYYGAYGRVRAAVDASYYEYSNSAWFLTKARASNGQSHSPVSPSAGVEALVVAASPTARLPHGAFRVTRPPITAPAATDGAGRDGAISGRQGASSAVIGPRGRRNDSLLRMISVRRVERYPSEGVIG